MAKSLFGYIALFICLILAQVLICNHIFIFNVAIPVIFIYMIIRLPMNMSVNNVLTIAFFSGLIVDIFSDTPGVNAMACTLTAMIRRPILYSYIPKDDRTKEIMPSISSLGMVVYSKYLLTFTLIYCVLIFSIEYFSFANLQEIIIMSLSSSVLSFLLLLGIDSLVTSANDSM